MHPLTIRHNLGRLEQRLLPLFNIAKETFSQTPMQALGALSLEGSGIQGFEKFGMAGGSSKKKYYNMTIDELVNVLKLPSSIDPNTGKKYKKMDLLERIDAAIILTKMKK
ncbi:hypothetical protein [Agarilytica rhodophyticola]|uniref:hypothetical protein n=1 Tax=Agarilytica rhodophyticola TaxID=1737490 RepID=UPI0013153569|nr:hypothetical protein [Agarilytica rhodophyticola]